MESDHPLQKIIDLLDALDGRRASVTVVPTVASADIQKLAAEVVKQLNTPGGPTLSPRAIR